MKRLLAAAIIIVLILIGWWYFHNTKKAAAPTQAVKVEPASTHPNPSNATFAFDDGPITLKNGSATTNVTPNGEITQDTTLTDDVAYGDVNGDGKTDAAVLLVQQGSGSGVFLYVAAYLSGVVQYSGSNAVFIGDRVTPKSISIDKAGTITVSYLDRGPNDAMATEPTVLTTKNFTYRGGQLEEK